MHLSLNIRREKLQFISIIRREKLQKVDVSHINKYNGNNHNGGGYRDVKKEDSGRAAQMEKSRR
jgi:hypothetical protein